MIGSRHTLFRLYASVRRLRTRLCRNRQPHTQVCASMAVIESNASERWLCRAAWRWIQLRFVLLLCCHGAVLSRICWHIPDSWTPRDTLPCATVLLDKDLILTGAVLDGDA
jgi:hypothetical protein